MARQTHSPLPVDAAYEDVVTPSLERLLLGTPETTDPVLAWRRWELPKYDGECENDHWPAHTCVTLLPCGSPCVVRVARNGNCSFFVRLKRSFWENVNKGWGVTVDEAWSHHAFCCGLSHNAGVFLLRNARAYQLSAGSVHHPLALSVLCNMGRAGLLIKPITGALVPPKEFGGKFELVALPPCPLVVEECFCLLGHKSTFSSPLVGDGGNAVDASVWGKVHGSAIRSQQDSEKFKSAGRLISKHNVARTLRNMPTLNAHFAFSSTTLAVLNAGYVICLEERSRSLLAPSDEEDGDDEEDGHGSSRATVAAAEAPNGPKGHEGEEEEEAPDHPPARGHESSTSEGAKAEPRRCRGDDDVDSGEEDDDELREESEQSDAPQTSDNESSDDNSSSDDSGEGGVVDSEEGEEEPRRKRLKKGAARSSSPTAASVAEDQKAHHHVAHLKELARVEAKEMFRAALLAHIGPTCAHVQRNLLQGPGAEAISARRKEQLQHELEQLHPKSKSSDEIVAGWASLSRTLVDMQADPPVDGLTRISAAERVRVRALSEQAVGFAAATFEDVDAAIAQSREQTRRLEAMRKRGYDVLEAVEGGGIVAMAAPVARQANAS